MAGIIFLIIILIIKFIKACQPMNKEMHNYNKARKNGDKFFINRDGYYTDTKYGVSYNYKHLWDGDKLGDYVKYNPYNGHILENVSERLRKEFEEKSRERAIEFGYRLYAFESVNNSPHDYDIDLYFLKGYNNHKNDTVKGIRLKDVDTDKVYVVRYYNNDAFLLNVDTLEIEGIYSSMTFSASDKKVNKIRQENDNPEYRKAKFEECKVYQNSLCDKAMNECEKGVYNNHLKGRNIYFYNEGGL